MTTLSPSCRFAEASIPKITKAGEADWWSGTGEWRLHASSDIIPTDRYIYALQRYGSTVNLHSEYLVDAGGYLEMCDGQSRRDAEKTGILPPFRATGSKTVSFEESDGFLEKEYFFFATRFRLPAKFVVNRLITQKPATIPWMKISALCTYYPDGPRLPVIDPLQIASRMSYDYHYACNLLLQWTTAYSGQDDELSQRIRFRGKKKFLAEVLKQLMESEKGEDVEACLKDGTRETVDKFLADYDDTFNIRVNNRNNLGKALCLFLKSELMDFTEKLYRADESESYHLFLKGMEKACLRLNECPNGRARLGEWLRAKPYWLSQYVLPEATLNDTRFQVGRKGAAAISGLLAEFVPALATENPRALPAILDRGIQFVTRTKVLTYLTTEGFVTNRFKVTKSPVSVKKYLQVAELTENGLRDTVANWAHTNADRIKTLESLNRLVEVANLFMAAQAVFEGEKSDPWEPLNLLGAGLDTIKAFEGFGRLSLKPLLTVGAMSAVIDVVLALKDGYNAYAKNDDDAGDGYSMVALGSTLIFLGYASGITACGGGTAAIAATLAGGSTIPLSLALGIVGACMVASGYIIVMLCADSDLETFVKHCYFGENYGKGDEILPWSEGRLSEWKNRGNLRVCAKYENGVEEKCFDRQLTAMFNLLSAFTVEFKSETKVRITPRLIAPGSTFLIEAEVEGVAVTGVNPKKNFNLTVNPAKGTIETHSTDRIDQKRVQVTDGYFELDLHPEHEDWDASEHRHRPDPNRPFLQTNTKCRIRLNILEKRFVPPDPRVVATGYIHTTWPFYPSVESKDF